MGLSAWVPCVVARSRWANAVLLLGKFRPCYSVLRTDYGIMYGVASPSLGMPLPPVGTACRLPPSFLSCFLSGRILSAALLPCSFLWHLQLHFLAGLLRNISSLARAGVCVRVCISSGGATINLSAAPGVNRDALCYRSLLADATWADGERGRRSSRGKGRR